MAFLSDRDRQETARLLEQLDNDVTLSYFTQRESPLYLPGRDCETCSDTRMLLEEVATLSPKIHLVVHEFTADDPVSKEHGIERIPALVVSSNGIRGKARFFGMPAGYEFSTLLDTMVAASKGQVDLADKTKESVAGIDKDVHIQVFVTPT